MNWVQNLLGSASVADILVYAAIIAIFVLGIAKCVMPVLNTRRLLLRAIRNIKAGDNAKISWQDDKFLGKMLAHFPLERIFEQLVFCRWRLPQCQRD